MLFDNMNISRKLQISFAVVVATVMAMAGSLYLSLGSIRQATDANAHSIAILKAADAALTALVEQQNAVRGFVATDDNSFLPRIDGFQKDFDRSVGDLAKLSESDDMRNKVNALVAAAGKVHREHDQQISLRQNAATVAQAQASILTVGRLTTSREIIKSITDPEQAMVVARSAAQSAAFAGANTMLLCGMIAAAGLSILVGWLLTRSIAVPVSAMTRAMDQLAAGDHAVVVPAMGRRDEVGRMAHAVQAFKVAAVEKLRLEAEALESRRLVEAQQRAAEAERARLAAEQAVVVDSVAGGLEKLAGGVLTYRLSQSFAPAYEQLRADFNAAMEQLQSAMKVVADNTSGIRTGAGEISQASDDLARRTEHQAASLEETAAALDQITATVRKTSSGARQAREAVSAARQDTERSSVVMRDAVTAMSDIEASAGRISQIIGVIDEIAFQTNLLALNAGVEAARAGDSGRGFAVVAQEVRALAQRSADAAKEIKALISASSQQVDLGVALVGQTGQALERIAEQVTQLNGLVAEIAVSTEEQAVGLQQVNTAINQMDQLTQQNAAMVEESTAASHALAQEAVTLARLVERFETGSAQRVPHRRAA